MNLKLKKSNYGYYFIKASCKLTKCPFRQAQCRAVFPDFGSFALMNWGWLWKNTIIFSTVSNSLSRADLMNSRCHDPVFPGNTWYRNLAPAFSCLLRLGASIYIWKMKVLVKNWHLYENTLYWLFEKLIKFSI